MPIRIRQLRYLADPASMNERKQNSISLFSFFANFHIFYLMQYVLEIGNKFKNVTKGREKNLKHFKKLPTCSR
jgi:hypothetical protein